MYRRNLSLAVIIFAALSVMLGADTAKAIPDDRTIEYNIYETPNDPRSDVIFVVRLELVADQQINGRGRGGSVGWEVTEIRLTEPGQGDNPDLVWVEEAPIVDTLDGLWWIDHADLGVPDIADFVFRPAFEGTAMAVNLSEEDLDYALEEVVRVRPTTPRRKARDNTRPTAGTRADEPEDPPPVPPEEEPADGGDGVNDPS